MRESTSTFCDLAILDTLTADSIKEIFESYNAFCSITEALVNGDCSLESDFVTHIHVLCKHSLQALVRDHFIRSLEDAFERNCVAKFWSYFDVYSEVANEPPVYQGDLSKVLCKALEELSLEKHYQENCLLLLLRALQLHKESFTDAETCSDVQKAPFFSKYHLTVSSLLMATIPRYFPEMLHWYFKGRLEELSTVTYEEVNYENGSPDKDDMDVDEKNILTCRTCKMDIDEYRLGDISENNEFVKSIGKVVQNLRNLGLTSMAEDAYASAIFLLLKAKVHDFAADDYHNSVLQSIKDWMQAVPLQFLQALLTYLGESVIKDNQSLYPTSPLASLASPARNTPSEGLVRWKLRLEYFAYETLQDLRIGKLFEIIVDYPESLPSIEDLKQCLEYTGQHSKLVESFISALKYRLLTAGASTNDILHQYVSTIKALRTIDAAGVFLEAVGEPIRDYLKGRKDTIKCIVTMLTDGTGGNPNVSGSSGDSLLEELNKDGENQEIIAMNDDFNANDKQAWISAMLWEPDPVDADPSKGSRNRRKADILGMIVGIIGSKDQLVNEYRVMLAEKLLNKSDYDIDSEIRTLELLKIHFGESSMQRCEIMLNDIIDSKRTNTNIKAIGTQAPQGTAAGEADVSLDNVDATIISSNFWPPIQDETLNLPEPVDKLLSDYASRFHQVKTPRKLLWKKNLGSVKLELQFQDRATQFTVAPIHAAIIMQFQDQTSWTSKDLGDAIGLSVDILNRRINFWIGKGVLAESVGQDLDNHVFTLLETADPGKNSGNGGNEDLLVGEEEGDRSTDSVEEQIRKEMTVYEKFIMGMLTNFGSMALDRIHNTLKMFCVADPPYDKSLQQLQSFLAGLICEEKVELRDGMYLLKK